MFNKKGAPNKFYKLKYRRYIINDVSRVNVGSDYSLPQIL